MVSTYLLVLSSSPFALFPSPFSSPPLAQKATNTSAGAKQCMMFNSDDNVCAVHQVCAVGYGCPAGQVCIATDSTCCKQTGDTADFRCFRSGYGMCTSPEARVRSELMGHEEAASVAGRALVLDEPVADWVPGLESVDVEA